MAILNGQVGDAGGTNTLFVNDTRLWAGGTAAFNAAETFDVAAGNTVSADDCMVVATYLGPSAASDDIGTFNFRDVVFSSNNAGQVTSSHNWTFRNVTYYANDLTGTINIGKFGGTLNNTTAYDIDGFNVFGNVDAADPTLGFLIFFPSFNGLTAGSTLNNINFWNGETDAATILGGAPTFAYSTFAGLRSGPIGIRPFYDASSNARALFRCAFGAANNNWGHLTSYDFRAIEGVAGQWRFALDNAGKVRMINPLVGTPTDKIAWANGTTSNGSAFQTYIGQQPRIEGDVKFVNADTTVTMVTFPAVFNATSVITTSPDVVTQLNGAVAFPNGFGFEVQNGTLANGNVTLYSATGTNPSNVNFVFPQTRIYRTYSWQQAEWGMDREINPTDTGATDAQVAADRESGIYPFCTADGFQTNINLPGTNDAITDGFATVALASTALHAVGGATNPRDVLASLKAAHHNGITETDVALPYTVVGTNATVTENLTLSNTASAAPALAGDRIVPASSISTEDVETILTLTSTDLTVVGGILDNTDEKASLTATGTFTTTSNIDTATISGATVSATGSTSNSGITVTGDNASTLGNITNATITANSLAPATVLTVGNIADSTVSTTGTLTVDADGFSGINTLSAGSFTSLETTANSLSNLTLRGDYIFTGTDSVTLNNVDWNTGTYTLPSTAVITGDSDFNGTINIPANGVYTVIGAEASINTAATLNFAGDADITFQDGATEQTFFGGRTLPSDVELITSPLIVTLTNNGLGNQYFNLTDDSDNFIDSSRYILAGESTDANGDPFIEVGDSITIQIAVTDINQEVWGLYVVGEGVVDSTFGIQYDGTVLAMDLAAAVDTNYNTGDIANRLDGWELIDRPAERISVSGFDTGTLNGEYSRVTGADIPTFTGFDPDGSQNTPVTDSIVYRRPGANAAAHRYVWNRADTTTTQGGWHISAADATANAWAFGYVNRTVLTPQTDDLFSVDTWFTTSGTAGTNPSDPQGSAEIIDNTFREFGITIPSGQVAYGNRINSTVGQFKSNKQYADYVAKNGVGNGITFNGVDRTQFFYNGPEVGDVNHETEYSMGMRVDGETNIQALSAFHPTFPNWRIKQFRMGWKTSDNTSYDTDEPGFFRDISNPSDATDIREFVFTNANFNAAFGATDEIIRGLQFVLRVVNADGTLTRIGSGNQYFRMFDTTNAPPTQTTPTNLTVGGAYGSNTAPTSYLRSFIIAWDPVLFDGVAGIGDNGTPGFGYTNDANPVELRFDRVLSTAVQGSSVPTRTYMDIDVTGTATPVRASGVEYLIQDAGGNDDLVLNVGNDDWPQTGSIDGTAIDRGNINLSIVDGQSISIYPNDESGNPILTATPESQVLDMRPIESDVVDYATIQARTIAALGEAGVSTTEEVEDVGAQVDNNNTRLQSINSGDASKIPTRRDYDSNNYTPDSII